MEPLFFTVNTAGQLNCSLSFIHTEAVERRSVSGGDDDALKRFYLSTYFCNPLHVALCANPDRLPLACYHVVATYDIRVDKLLLS
jgi:hypothetical protein